MKNATYPLRRLALASLFLVLAAGLVACGTDDASRPGIDDSTDSARTGGVATSATGTAATPPTGGVSDLPSLSIPGQNPPPATGEPIFPEDSSFGPLPDPPTGAVCPEDFGRETACGGDITGTWEIQETCADIDLEGIIANLCPGATIDLGEVSTSGTLTITESEFDRDVQIEAELEAFIPQSCVDQAAGFGIQGCEGLAGALQGQLGEDASCTEIEGGCACTGELDFAALNADSSGVYQQDGGRIAIAGTDRRFWVCADGDTLYIRDTGQADAFVPATLVEVYARQ